MQLSSFWSKKQFNADISGDCAGKLEKDKQKQRSGEQSQPWGLQASVVPNSLPWLFIDYPNFITVDAFEIKPQDLRLTEGPVTLKTHTHTEKRLTYRLL